MLCWARVVNVFDFVQRLACAVFVGVGVAGGSPPCLMTTGLSLARVKLAKKARFQWVPLRAGPAGLSKRTKQF
jgi:hypothetical protein